MRCLVDFHHLSLFNSLVRLFQDRLGISVYRPIGLDWHSAGFWNVHDHPETIKQYLGINIDYVPPDGTPPLNSVLSETLAGVYFCADPETGLASKAVTLDWFKENKFDYVVASMPQHVEPFRRLIKEFQPDAKLIVQIGNKWDSSFPEANLLCSVHPSQVPYFKNSHAVSYHQEFDLSVFYPSEVKPTGRVSSYINNIERYAGGSGWKDFAELENRSSRAGLNWNSFGGQCRDGCLTSSIALANSMREDSFVFHVKPGGDGYGHVVHNAFAVGRPVVARSSDYRGSWAGELMVQGSFIDLDKMATYDEAAATLIRLNGIPEELTAMGTRAKERFSEVVDFDREELDIRRWIEALR